MASLHDVDLSVILPLVRNVVVVIVDAVAIAADNVVIVVVFCQVLFVTIILQMR